MTERAAGNRQPRGDALRRAASRMAPCASDGGLILGMTSRDPSFGFTAGLTWVFRGYSVP